MTTKLNTSMGVELTFIHPIFQQINDVFRPDRDGIDSDVITEHAQNRVILAFAPAMRKLLDKRKIKVHAVTNDPCVLEVPTMPYKTEGGLSRAIRGITGCAKTLGLVPTLPLFYGGGCHIHTGKLGNTYPERENYARRMMVFGCQNPWLVRAFVGLADGVGCEATNAGLITRERIHNREEEYDLPQLEYLIEKKNKELRYYERALHTIAGWSSAWMYLGAIRGITLRLMQLRKQWLRLKRAEPNSLPLESIYLCERKNTALRSTRYSKTGTIEFRMFEMPEDWRTIMRYVKLVNAVVAHVAAQDYTSVNVDTLFTAEQCKALTWRQWRDGFNRMLVTLGLDPADWKAERVNLALHVRAKRPTPTLAERMDAACAATGEALRDGTLGQCEPADITQLAA